MSRLIKQSIDQGDPNSDLASLDPRDINQTKLRNLHRGETFALVALMMEIQQGG